VHLLLADASYRERAQALSQALRRHDALAEITQALQSLHSAPAVQALAA
jgi:UDP:flavonoid glycosyltransferase YjiC (YdhE family)